MRRTLFVALLLIAGSCYALGQTHAGEDRYNRADHHRALARCLREQLSVRRHSDDAGAGQRAVNYAFTNRSSTPCTLAGYPRFELLNKLGRHLRGVRVTYQGGSYFQQEQSPEVVTVEPGKIAWFAITFSACQDPGRCPTSAKVGITAPGTRRPFVIKESLSPHAGSIDVLPVRGGTPD